MQAVNKAFTLLEIVETIITAAIPASLGWILVSKGGKSPLLKWLGYWSIALGILYLLIGLLSIPVSIDLL